MPFYEMMEIRVSHIGSHRMHPIFIYSVWFIRNAGCVHENLCGQELKAKVWEELWRCQHMFVACQWSTCNVFVEWKHNIHFIKIAEFGCIEFPTNSNHTIYLQNLAWTGFRKEMYIQSLRSFCFHIHWAVLFLLKQMIWFSPYGFSTAYKNFVWNYMCTCTK